MPGKSPERGIVAGRDPILGINHLAGGIAVREAVITLCGAAYIETDMRAHRNPTRMRAIERATLDLVRRYVSRWPRYARPGFALSEGLSGLPYSWCGGPTLEPRGDVYRYEGCGCRQERAATAATADPGKCGRCNP